MSQNQIQGESPDLITNDPAVQQIISERNSLRAQNEQLWKIIEKQRVIIQNLQKDVSKITAERDQLRSCASPPSSSSLSGHEGGSVNGRQHQQSPPPPAQQQQQPTYSNLTSYQPTTQYQPSLNNKRSMERGDRRAQQQQQQHESDLPSEQSFASYDKDPELASGFNPNASFTSTISTSDHRSTYPEQQPSHSSTRHHHPHPHQQQQYQHSHQNGQLQADTDFEPSRTDARSDESSSYATYDQGHPSRQTDQDLRQDTYDPEIQLATTHRTQIQANGSSHPPGERDARSAAPRSDATHAHNGHGPRVGLNGAPVPAHLMPQLPPRSPRRDHRNDQSGSPNVSDNEDDSYQAQQVPRRRTPTTPRLGATREYVPDQNYPLSPTGEFDLRDGPVTTASKVSIKHANSHDVGRTDPETYQPATTYMPTTPSTPAPSKHSNNNNQHQGSSSSTPRKNVSGHIQAIPANLSLNVQQVAPELNPSSPVRNMGDVNSQSTPASPIATIIDQDAEKFRSFMNKMNSPTRKAPATNEHKNMASAIGQAVAMETIQQQIELHNQLMSQSHGPVQGQGQGQGPSSQGPSNGQNTNQSQWDGSNENDVSINVDVASHGDSGYPHEQSQHHHHHQQQHHHQHHNAADRNANQLSLPGESRDRRRESTVQMYENYPKIAARSTSHNRDVDDSRDYTNAPHPPKRYDSQPSSEHVNSMDSARPTRSASPTPSGNSSLTNAPSTTPSNSTSHTRSGPTSYQQNMGIFGDHLELMSVIIVGSTIGGSEKGKEQPMFLVSVGQQIREGENAYPHRESEEQWRVEKQYNDFVSLDSKLRITQSRNVINSMPRLPDRGLFSTHAPSKADARKVALEQYIQQLTSLRFKDNRDICEFLSTNVVERERRRDVQEGWKEGYLTKRGKNFGGWKTRYFVLRGPSLEYFDMKDGHHLGSISLTFAQIGRQQSQDKSNDGANDGKEGTDPNSYRHAFLILEPKKGQTVADARKNPNNVMRHVLCAETDEERDAWVHALLLYVGKEDPNNESPDKEKEREREREKEKERSGGRRMPEIQMVAATPIKDLASVKGNEKLLLNQEAYERQQRAIVPPSPSAQQQFHSQSRQGSMPMSPTTTNMNMDDRQSLDRQGGGGGGDLSGNGRHHPYNNNNQAPWNEQELAQRNGHPHQQQQQQQHYQQHQQQPQLPRNQSSHSLNQEDAMYKQSAEPQPQLPQLSKEEIAEKKQRSRMTFHWPKKAAKEEPPIQQQGNSAQQGNSQQQQSSSSNTSSSGGGLRGFLGGGSKPSSNNNGNMNGQGSHNGHGQGNGGGYQPLAPIRQVFGVSIEQAVDQARVQPGYELPAVVYRCIEYLNYHKAKLEEGIYRLNGSSAVIKSLKDRFNHEGDVPLLAHEEYYDIHAVAGLLKLFLRDLPSSVLTRELHKDFLSVIELPNRGDRVNELTRLVSILPEANYTLLRALTAHLIEIVANANVNKMTARNVGIVFSPTLGIPAGVFALLMSDFDKIFNTQDGRIMPLENSDMQPLRTLDYQGGPEPMMMA